MDTTKKRRKRQADPKRNRIRDWKGLLGQESRKTRVSVFALLLLVSVSMTFTQLGYIGVGAYGVYLTYAFGLLAPITLCSLLLGKGWGALFGALSGSVLFVHARLQPLDIFERYFVSILNSVVIYLFAGFFLGLLFAIALHNDPRGIKRGIYLFIISFVTSLAMSTAFFLNALADIVISMVQEAQVNGVSPSELEMPTDTFSAISGIGDIFLQAIVNLFIIFFVALFAGFFVRHYQEARNYVSLRTTFRMRLLVSVALVYLVVQAGIFTITTLTSETAAAQAMDEQIEFIGEQLKANTESAMAVVDSPDLHKLSAETLEAVFATDSSQRLIAGYDPADGIIAVFTQGIVLYSDSKDYPTGAAMEDVMGKVAMQTMITSADTGRMRITLFGAQSVTDILQDDADDESQGYAAELGYMRAAYAEGNIIMVIMPASRVFESRSSTVMWGSFLALTLSIAVYIAAARLLSRVVVKPINRTNDSLVKITQGDLDELVTETDCVEFASLSAGINTTVDALKGLINETERRMERDLATAKAIQESALPRTFPPFPEIEAFDIYASMNAAKEVGGDFYDFFLINDHTLGFLIADVSGKGIPGALFMMAAKTEIENYLSTGMDPSEAIASANKRLCANNDAGMFVTVWAATLDFDTGLLTYVNAGHNFPLLRHGKGGEWEWLKKKCGLFLGTFDTAKYRQETLTLATGDELILYTDGVNEAFSQAEEEFGNDRLESWLDAHRDLEPEELVRGLRAEVAAWAEGAEQSDDITILALEYGAVPEASGSATMPATLKHLDDAIGLVADELERRLCPLGVQHKVEVALEELFVNVCRYAYADKDEPGEVTVSYLYRGDPRSISVELRDEGTPFDPVTMVDPTKPSDIQEAKVGGLGIFMVKNSMDDLHYKHEEGQNVVTFVKGW